MRTLVALTTLLVLGIVSYVLLFKTQAYLTFCRKRYPSGLIRDLLFTPEAAGVVVARIVGIGAFVALVLLIVGLVWFPSPSV